MTTTKYPELDEGATVIVPWGPGMDHGMGNVDVTLIAYDRDDRPDGGTVTVLEIACTLPEPTEDAEETEIGTFAAVELTEGDLVRLGNWAFGEANGIHRDETITKQEIHNLQVVPTVDGGESVEWIEDPEDMIKLTAWSVYARIGDPSDQFVKAEFISDFLLKQDAVRLAFLLSAGRWPIEVIDPRVQ